MFRSVGLRSARSVSRNTWSFLKPALVVSTSYIVSASGTEYFRNGMPALS